MTAAALINHVFTVRLCYKPSVLDEGVIMSRVRLSTVDNDTYKLILNLRSIDRHIRLKGRVRGRHVEICITATLAVCVRRL